MSFMWVMYLLFLLFYFYPYLCRSILTVPWMEMGGQTAITCAKSGYNANIHFHCKVSILDQSKVSVAPYILNEQV